MQLDTSLQCGPLIEGNTITGICIQHAILMGYVKQADSLHKDCGLLHPKLVAIDYIKIMTKAVKKYETVPKKQEMISDSMFHYRAHLACHASLEYFIRAISNWIILKCYTGFQKSGAPVTTPPLKL